MILFALLSCIPKLPDAPALQPFYALEAAPSNGNVFTTEGQAVLAVQNAMSALGLSEASAIPVRFTEQRLWPVWVPGETPSVEVPRFLLDDPLTSRRWAAVGQLGWSGEGPAADREQYLAWMVGGIAEALAHGVAWKRGSAYYENGWKEEERARKVEWATLSKMVENHAIPASWLDAWKRAQAAMLAANPSQGNFTSLETLDQENSYLWAALQEPTPGDYGLSEALKISGKLAVQAQDGSTPDMVALFAQSPSRVLDNVRYSIAQYGEPGTVVEGALVVKREDMEIRVEVEEGKGAFRMDAGLSFVPGAAHQADLEHLINLYYQTEWRAASHDYRLILKDGILHFRSGWIPLSPTGRPTEVDDVYNELLYSTPLWLAGFQKVNSGIVMPEWVINAIRDGNSP